MASSMPLEPCTSLVILGNQIALRVLEYLSIARHPPQGLSSVAVDFVEVSRALLAIRAGLMTGPPAQDEQLPKYVVQDLRNRLQIARTTFLAWDQMIHKYMVSEKKKNFGKLGKGLRMMFAESDVEKMKASFEHCRASLSVSALLLTSKLGSYEINAADAIGFVALATVLQCPDPTIPKKSAGRPSPIEIPTISTPASIASPTVSSYPTGPLPSLPSPSFVANATPKLTSKSASNLRQPASLAESQAETHSQHPTVRNYSVSKASPGAVVSDGNDGPRQTRDGEADTASLLTYPSYLSESQPAQSPPREIKRSDGYHAMRVDISAVGHARQVPVRTGSKIRHQSASPSASPVNDMADSAIELGPQKERGSALSNSTDRGLLFEAVINEDIESMRLLLSRGADGKGTSSRHSSTPLYAATNNSSFEAAELLLEYGADPTSPASALGESALSIAVADDKLNFVQLYLRHGADPNVLMASGETAFTQAMNENTSLEIVEAFISHHADLNLKNRHGETPLFRAISAKREDLVRCLLQHRADPNLPGPKIMLWPAVHQPPILEALLQHGAKIERAPGVLELATSINSPRAVAILLKYRTDPNAKKDGIYTPLCSAIRDGRDDLVDVLLKAGADPNLPALDYPVFKCISYHRENLLPRLIAAGADLHHPKGAVESAVAHENKAALQFLLENSVDVNCRNTSGHTALTTAIKSDDVATVDLLLSHGADPSVRGHDWPIRLAVTHPRILDRLLPHIARESILKGVLEVAVVANQLESVKLLLAKGVSVEEKNGGVFSPLTTAIRENRKDIFQFLINEATPPADVNAPGEHLPIVKAIRRHREQDLSYIKALLDKGANVNLLHCGWNAVLQALDNGDLKILKMLAGAQGGVDFDVQDTSGRTVREILIEGNLVEEAKILGLQL